jgi:uncharacterized protein (TIGR03437 family)
VFFDGIPAPLLYARADQVSAVVPYGFNNAAIANLQVSYGAIRSLPIPLRIVPTVPGIFTADASGLGTAAAINQDGTLNTAASPAAKGTIVTFFATGEGQTNPPEVDGKLAAVPLPAPVLGVVVGVASNRSRSSLCRRGPGLRCGIDASQREDPLGCS